MSHTGTSHIVSYTTSDGFTIQAKVFIPENPNGFGVICLHQFQLNHASYEQFAALLCDTGVYVIAPDLRGHGESTSQNGKTLTFESMTEDEFRKIPGLDVEAAKNHLVKTFSLNPENIGIVGASIGANAALISAGRNPQTAFVVALSPGIDYRGIQPANDVAQIQKPVLLVASQDDTYSAASATELAERIPSKNKMLTIVSASAHGTHMFEDKSVLQSVVDWIMKVIS